MKKAIMYGAGNIGRGFIGQLFSLSGYEVGFVDVNEAVISRLNADRKYNVYVTDGDGYKTHTVSPVFGIDGKNTDLVAAHITSASIMATAVGVNVLKFIAEPIAMGIKKRMADAVTEPLNIIICENMIGADKHLENLIKGYLSSAEAEYFDRYVGLVEPSIGRMVPATPKSISENDPIAVCVEPYCELPVDRDAFKGDIPEIKSMIPFSPFDFYIRRKLFMHNMSHALTAYLGNLRGYEYIWQAIGDVEIRSTARKALVEISDAMSKEYGVPYDELEDFSLDLIRRYDNKLLGDTTLRVGKDTKRKLSENDRFVGAIRLCMKHDIVPESIIKGMAAGFLFYPESDESSLELKAFLDKNGIFAAMEKYCNISRDDRLAAMIAEEYNKLIKNSTIL